jgi:carboxypeptidase PM20D1
MSHQDVVEANGEWKHDPFSGDIDEDGNVWGRGAVDTKASLFCIFTALEELIAEGYEPECDVYIGSSCTEEWSGDGAPATVAYLKEQGVKLALVLDEGGLIIDEPMGGVKGTFGMVGVVEKGYGDLRFTAHGKGGHASAPTKNTPLVRLAKFMTDVEKHYPFRAEISPTVEEMFRRMAPNMDFGMKLIFANLWLFKPLLTKLLPSISSSGAAMVRTTIGFTMAKGADGLNVLPSKNRLPSAETSVILPSQYTFLTVILFCVKVPVLSVHITLVQPNVSTAGSLRTSALRLSIRLTPIVSDTVTTAGNPSGIAATARDTADINISKALCP